MHEQQTVIRVLPAGIPHHTIQQLRHQQQQADFVLAVADGIARERILTNITTTIPDILILGYVEQEPYNFFELLQAIHVLSPRTKIITLAHDVRQAFESILAGSGSYVYADEFARQIIPAIEAVWWDRGNLDAAVAALIVAHLPDITPPEQENDCALSPLEWRLLFLLSEQMPQQEITRQLDIPGDMLTDHIGNIFLKLAYGFALRHRHEAVITTSTKRQGKEMYHIGSLHKGKNHGQQTGERYDDENRWYHFRIPRMKRVYIAWYHLRQHLQRSLSPFDDLFVIESVMTSQGLPLYMNPSLTHRR